MAKNDHMLAILWMLSSGSKITAKQISEKLEINIRTVYRYIDALSVSGVPIISESGHNGGYTLLNRFIEAPLLFDMAEKKALLQAAVFAKEAGHPASEALDRVTLKLKSYSNEEQESRLSHHIAGFEVINHKVDPLQQQLLTLLEQAVGQEYSLEIDYRTGREEHSKLRVIDPYGVVYWNHKWYTVGYCHLRGDIRSFRVDRILSIQQTKLTFKRPEQFSTRESFMKNLLPSLITEKEWVSLVVQGRVETLDDLCLHWFLGHYLKERTPHEAIFLIEESSMYSHVPYLLLPYGKSIQIIEPQALKERLIEVTSELMAYYKL